MPHRHGNSRSRSGSVDGNFSDDERVRERERDCDRDHSRNRDRDGNRALSIALERERERTLLDPSLSSATLQLPREHSSHHHQHHHSSHHTHRDGGGHGGAHGRRNSITAGDGSGLGIGGAISAGVAAVADMVRGENHRGDREREHDQDRLGGGEYRGGRDEFENYGYGYGGAGAGARIMPGGGKYAGRRGYPSSYVPPMFSYGDGNPSMGMGMGPYPGGYTGGGGSPYQSAPYGGGGGGYGYGYGGGAGYGPYGPGVSPMTAGFGSRGAYVNSMQMGPFNTGPAVGTGMVGMDPYYAGGGMCVGGMGARNPMMGYRNEMGYESMHSPMHGQAMPGMTPTFAERLNGEPPVPGTVEYERALRAGLLMEATGRPWYGRM